MKEVEMEPDLYCWYMMQIAMEVFLSSYKPSARNRVDIKNFKLAPETPKKKFSEMTEEERQAELKRISEEAIRRWAPGLKIGQEEQDSPPPPPPERPLLQMAKPNNSKLKPRPKTVRKPKRG